MNDYDRQVIESAERNHIWLDAMMCINPSEEFLAQIGRAVLGMVERRGNWIYPDQESESEPLRRLGKLTPQVVIRVNKS